MKTSFDERPEITSGKFFRLQKKGDSIVFRLIDEPHRKDVHWVDKKPYPCEKMLGENECKYCELAMSQDEVDQDIAKVQRQYYYLVLDREEGDVKIFRTVPSVHWQMCDHKEDGYKVYETDWLVKRTEKKGSYYVVKPSPEQAPIGKEDKKKIEDAKTNIDLSVVIGEGQKSGGLPDDEESDEIASAADAAIGGEE